MSTDSSRPSPDPKIDILVSKTLQESTEMDLWDMDLDEEAIPDNPEKINRSSAQLPVQRKSVLKIKTKKHSGPKPKSAKAAELIEPGQVPEELPNLERISEELTEPIKDQVAEQLKDQVTETTAKEIPADSENDPFDDLLDVEQEMPTEQVYPTEEWEEVENVSTAKPDKNSLPDIPTTGSLSKIEKIAIFALCAVFALGAILTLIHFSNHVPTRSLVTKELDFPVSGKIVEITAASTYWREPITKGENADVVRRDTKLIPVLKLSLRSKSGAIRAFFRNEEGLVMGDGITRTVKGNAEVTIAATAGFEDVGMHTAYRMGDSKRWVVQVFEGPDATSPREKFRKVLETEIATQIQ